MQTTIRCRKCKNPYVFAGSIETLDLCPECSSVEKRNYETVREYVEKHPGCTARDASSATAVSMQTILRYLKEGKLGTIKKVF